VNLNATFSVARYVKLNCVFPNSTAMEDIASRDSKARSSEQDAKNVRHDLKMMEQARESTLAENRWD
jgi:hypothetical protein